MYVIPGHAPIYFILHTCRDADNKHFFLLLSRIPLSFPRAESLPSTNKTGLFNPPPLPLVSSNHSISRRTRRPTRTRARSSCLLFNLLRCARGGRLEQPADRTGRDARARLLVVLSNFLHLARVFYADIPLPPWFHFYLSLCLFPSFLLPLPSTP